MDFMKLLKSFEEFLFELVSWIVFYPVTLWRTLRRPQAMMRYADVELADTATGRYADTLSPPLFLLVTLILTHWIELTFARLDVPWVRPSMLQSDWNLLVFRAFAYAVFPLLMSWRLLRRRGVAISRETLKPPFYSQCYVAVPGALGISLSAILVRIDRDWSTAAGVALFAATLLWYAAIETRWFRRELDLPAGRAAGIVVSTMLLGIGLILAGALALGYAIRTGTTAPG